MRGGMPVKCDSGTPHPMRPARIASRMQLMGELLRSNDPVLLSFATSLLVERGIPHYVADGHMSLLEGSLGILARRLIVPDDDIAKARAILKDAGLETELSPDV